jgi:2-polyprenyl-3-methyl-5-hydroxy-6-metoxy-1,4-benzoquinol methylase
VTSTQPLAQAPTAPPQAPPTGAMPPVDPSRLGAFMGRVLSDMSGAMVGLMGVLGDRLGLFRCLAAGPATISELAGRAGIDPRYARDWLGALTAAGYVEHDLGSDRYSLPAEHAVVLAVEGAPVFLGGGYQQLAGFASVLDRVAAAMTGAGGIDQSDYSADMHQGMERMSAGWFEHALVPQWIGAVPGLADRLAAGGRIADVGCGSGRALAALARAFPAASLTGYDIFAGAVARARETVAAAGAADRVTLVRRDAADGLDGPFDLVTTFDMLHDAARPDEIAAAVHRALAPDGVWLLVEINCGETVEANAGPAGAILYATSLLFCTPTSIAAGADALGAMGLPESRVRALCSEAGLRTVHRLPVENTFNAVYEVRP